MCLSYCAFNGAHCDCFLHLAGFCFLAVVHGYGKRTADMGESVHINLKVCIYAVISALYNARSKFSLPYNGFTKASILLLYLPILITESSRPKLNHGKAPLSPIDAILDALVDFQHPASPTLCLL